MTAQKWKRIVVGIWAGITLASGLLIERVPDNDLTAFKRFVGKEGHSFKRVPGNNGVRYVNVIAQDLRGIGFKDASVLLRKDLPYHEDGPVDTNQTPATMVIYGPHGQITLIDGPVPYDPDATVTVEQDIYTSGTKSLIFRGLETLGFRIAR